MEEVISRTLKKIADGPSDEIGISKFDLKLRLQSLTVFKKGNEPQHFRGQCRKFHRILPICRRSFWSGLYTNHFQQKH